jgi:tubulin-specific chaperone A
LERLLKEVKYYESEALENKSKLERMQNEGKDPYDIKKFKEVLDESLMMIPDSQRRLQIQLDDLCTFLDTNEILLKDDDLLKEARCLLQINDYQQKETKQITTVENDVDTF